MMHIITNFMKIEIQKQSFENKQLYAGYFFLTVLEIVTILLNHFLRVQNIAFL